MMSIDKGKYYGLDAIASQIWELLETPCSIRALCDQLLPRYDVGREQGEQDVLAFCQQAQEQGIIQVLDDRMSAIFGLIHFDGSPVEAEDLARMQQALAYWGGDGGGVWRQGHVGLGCNIRQITPESRYETFPVTGAAGNLWLAGHRPAGQPGRIYAGRWASPGWTGPPPQIPDSCCWLMNAGGRTARTISWATGPWPVGRAAAAALPGSRSLWHHGLLLLSRLPLSGLCLRHKRITGTAPGAEKN